MPDIDLNGDTIDDQRTLLLMHHRWYDPEIGRFIQQDPIGEEGGLNLYAYVGASPTMWVDPTGLKAARFQNASAASFNPLHGGEAAAFFSRSRGADAAAAEAKQQRLIDEKSAKDRTDDQLAGEAQVEAREAGAQGDGGSTEANSASNGSTETPSDLSALARAFQAVWGFILAKSPRAKGIVEEASEKGVKVSVVRGNTGEVNGVDIPCRIDFGWNAVLSDPAAAKLANASPEEQESLLSDPQNRSLETTVAKATITCKEGFSDDVTNKGLVGALAEEIGHLEQALKDPVGTAQKIERDKGLKHDSREIEERVLKPRDTIMDEIYGRGESGTRTRIQ